MPREVKQLYLQVDVRLQEDPDYIVFERDVKAALPDEAKPYAAEIVYCALQVVWRNFLEKHVAGRPAEIASTIERSSIVIESWVRWGGAPGAFARAFFDNMCEQVDGNLVIRGWDERYGGLAKGRAVERAKKQKQRDNAIKNGTGTYRIGKKQSQPLNCPDSEGTKSTLSDETVEKAGKMPPGTTGTIPQNVPPKRGHLHEMSPHDGDNIALLSPEKVDRNDKSIRGKELTLYPPPDGGGSFPSPPPPNSGGSLAIAATPPAKATAPPSDCRGVSVAVPEAQASLPEPLAAAITAVIERFAPNLDPTVTLQGITDPNLLARRAAYLASLDQAVADVEHDGARRAIRRMLEYKGITGDKVLSTVMRICGWRQSLGTSTMRPVTWEAIEQGLNELIDNDDGRKISAMSELRFVEKAEERRLKREASAVAESRPDIDDTPPPGMTRSEVGEARRYAEKGHPEWIELCRTNGIAFQSSEAKENLA